MKNLLIFTFFILILNSCSEPDFETASNLESITYNRVVDEHDNYELKKKFAKALHEAMLNNIDLLKFIKDESLQQFNGDYDILYNYIKAERVGGSTFREILLNYFEYEDVLAQIESQIPTLTIFVPSLPNNSFSAELWNTDEEVPYVAIRLLNNDKTPIISSNSQSYLLDHDVIPDFPVIVIKENERVSVPSYSGYDELTTEENSSTNGFKFKFSDSYYNNINGEYQRVRDKRAITISNAPEHLVDAWEVFGKEENLGWHRDYIYYGLQLDVPNGPWIPNFSEHFTNIKIEGSNGFNALQNITQPSVIDTQYSDPELIPIVFPSSSDFNQGSFWTDGKFDFIVDYGYSKDSNRETKAFDATPGSLFEIVYERERIIGIPFYRVVDIKQKILRQNLELRSWRLHSYDNEWEFQIFEIDNNVTINRNHTRQVKRNLNFENTLEKIGLKFGVTTEFTDTDNTQITWREEDIDLGQTSVHFDSNVVIGLSEHNVWIFNIQNYQLRRHTTGKVSFSLVPLQTQ